MLGVAKVEFSQIKEQDFLKSNLELISAQSKVLISESDRNGKKAQVLTGKGLFEDRLQLRHKMPHRCSVECQFVL